jgi:non-specific serine/threonine protein kinase/serine/threonine-protein kinase
MQRLGEGGMGEVWLAQQLQPVQRQVAIKVVKAGMDSARVVARFEAERQALAVMDHPAIAKVLDAGTTPEGRPYFAMEYVRGEPITAYCDRHRLPVRERLDLFIQLCDGIQHAHQKGIIHRDLKPSNILVTVTEDHPVPRIIDFGIAKAVAQPLTDHSLFTEVGMFIGTPEYMSPEQAELTPLDVDTRTDVYSLGVLLYELLTGTLPFESEGLRQAGIDRIRQVIREKDPPRPSTRVATRHEAASKAADRRATHPARLVGTLRKDLDWITMKALEKDRTRRYPTANGLALDVRRYLRNEPVSAGPPSAVYRARKFIRRHRVGAAASAAVVLLLLAFAVVTALQAARIARERDRANQEAATARQVSDFLVGLFKVSDPSQARGTTVTAREILANGARHVQDSLRDQPAVQARIESTIGVVYTSLGLYSDAAPLLERAVQTQKRLLGEDHSETLVSAHQLANVYWYQRKLDDAERLYVDVLSRRQRLLGEDHPDTLKAKSDLASMSLLRKRPAEAERLTAEVLAVQRRVLGADHPDTLSTMNNLQAIYFSQQRYETAEPIARGVLEARSRTLGQDHPDTLRAMHNLAGVYGALKRNKEAEALYTRALEGRRRVLGPTHNDALFTQLRLAAVYRNEQRYDQAETLALSAFEGLRVALGSDHERTRQAIQELVNLYDAQGNTKRAADWRAKLPAPAGPPR